MSNENETMADVVQSAWSRVREAITKRWPQIGREELNECEDNAAQLVQFVKQHVEASEEEVRAVVSEFAPEGSVVERVMHVASDGLNDAVESAQFAYMRVDECIAKRPTESVLTSFVAGIFLGATVTALWMSSRPERTAWDRIKSNPWG